MDKTGKGEDGLKSWKGGVERKKENNSTILHEIQKTCRVQWKRDCQN